MMFSSSLSLFSSCFFLLNRIKNKISKCIRVSHGTTSTFDIRLVIAGAMERCRCEKCDYDLCGNCRADLLYNMVEMKYMTASGPAARQKGATQMWKDHKSSRGRKVMRNSMDAVDVKRKDIIIVYDNNPTIPFPMKEEQEKQFPKAKLTPQVGNAYYCKPEDLCVCPRKPPCSYKGPNGTSDFECLDEEGKRTCEPGKTG